MANIKKNSDVAEENTHDDSQYLQVETAKLPSRSGIAKTINRPSSTALMFLTKKKTVEAKQRYPRLRAIYFQIIEMMSALVMRCQSNLIEVKFRRNEKQSSGAFSK